MSEYELPSYKECEQCVQQTQTVSSAAEAHGVMCGMLCTMNELAQRMERGTSVIEQLHYVTAQQLLCEDEQAFSFQLLLPDETTALSVRSKALAQWCEGFLVGLGEGGLTAEQVKKEAIKEMLHDIAEIAKLDSKKNAQNEDAEFDFIEVMEYVKVSVLTIYTDLQLGKEKQKTEHEE